MFIIQHMRLNPAHVETLGREKARPDFIKLARKLDAKIVPPRMPHGMRERLDPTPV